MSTLTAFLVEDSLEIRDNLTAALEELAPVQVVGSAEDELGASTWLSSDGNRCDLLIIDIFLKRGSGLGVLRTASALPASTNVVVLSNYATADMRSKCLELGASEVFDKSNEIEALIQHCTRLAGKARPAGALAGSDARLPAR